MTRLDVSDPRSLDQRRWRRMTLSVPVQFGKGIGEEGGAAPANTGQTVNVSTGGVYLTTREGGPCVPGEILTVSLSIPWESRKAFPFSRIVGSCRVVRVEEGPPRREH